MKLQFKIREFIDYLVEYFDSIFDPIDKEYIVIRTKDGITYKPKNIVRKEFKPAVVPYGKEIRNTLFFLLFLLAQNYF